VSGVVDKQGHVGTFVGAIAVAAAAAAAAAAGLFNITVVAAAHSSGLRSDALFVLVAEIVVCCIACLWGPGNAVNATSPFTRLSVLP